MKAKRIALAIAAAMLSSGVAWANHGGSGHGGGAGGWHGGAGGWHGGAGGWHGSAGGWHGGGWHEHHEWRHFYGGYGAPGIVFAPELFAPPFGEPFYSLPPPTIMAQAPPVYIERPNSGTSANAGGDAATGPGNVWYYCQAAGTYYPYIKECPSGWTTVPSQPQP